MIVSQLPFIPVLTPSSNPRPTGPLNHSLTPRKQGAAHPAIAADSATDPTLPKRSMCEETPSGGMVLHLSRRRHGFDGAGGYSLASPLLLASIFLASTSRIPSTPATLVSYKIPRREITLLQPLTLRPLSLSGPGGRGLRGWEL